MAQTSPDGRAMVPSDECDHPDLALRKTVFSNGQAHYAWQCLSCGVVSNWLKNSDTTEDEKASAGEVDREIRRLVWQEKSDALRREHDAEREAERRVWRERYERHMASPEWREKADAVLMRAGGICEGCRSRKARQVHHMTYAHLGDEFLFELVALCRPCHERWHEIAGEQTG